MPLKQSHDIGESLTLALETSVKGIDRAFVHIDYESTHSPINEHKNDALRENQKTKKSRPMRLTRDAQLVEPLLEESTNTSRTVLSLSEDPTIVNFATV